MRLVLIDGCPVPESVAPYIKLVLDHAGQTATSIYRGPDAAALLHAHGKHTQAEIHAMYPAISNPAGRSQHELRSDGSGNGGPVGRVLEEWEEILPNFIKVMPRDLKRVIQERQEAELEVAS